MVMTYKINSINNKKVYSAYITYSNEKEAAYAILCVDSLLIQGKIIRAFFGTTKYCSYFLNNQICPNLDKCLFLHQLIDDKDIIIDDNMIFSYNEHINLSKKIINYSDLKMKELILKMKKPAKIIFPFFDFIYLSEEEKEHYFTSGNISYFGSNSKDCKDNFGGNYDESKTDFNAINNYFNNSNANNKICDINANLNYKMKINHISLNNNINVCNNSFEPNEFHKLLDNSIKHILAVKPFYSHIKNFPLKKLELEFFKKFLKINNEDFYVLFEGCLDCINDII